MRPSFNTAGPCIADEHYMIPPERRLEEVLELIDERRYFTLTAGRQTGKTTSARWLVDHLNASGSWCALYVDVQTARDTDSPMLVFEVIREKLDHAVQRDLPELGIPASSVRKIKPSRTFLLRYLRDLAARAPHPLAIFFDEADALMGKAVVSFLTQLRDGYIDRQKTPFPASVVLIGQRTVRDYTISEKDQKAVSWLGTSSPFNITVGGLSIAPFTEADVKELLGQHTTKTGQVFAPEATALIYELGRGHPWLTSALADQITRRDVKDRRVTIVPEHVEAAKETIILERRTHIDSLISRLREPRVQRILDTMLAGNMTGTDVIHEDFAYALGLGLIAKVRGQYQIANPIYREVIPRALNNDHQMQIKNESAWYIGEDGSLDMPKLVTDWQTFWREDGHLAAEGFEYRESGPHLLLMAYLQRIVNGGGIIRREYGLGRRAIDLLIHWKDKRHAIEIKIRRDSETEAKGTLQLWGYLDQMGTNEGWLVLFDLRKEVPWQEKLFLRDVEHQGKRIHIVGC
ncbi:MAG TPA: ATP-binding protein [Polyangium sp.]|nr:ATP-binding protein [Polyangium sp.]